MRTLLVDDDPAFRRLASLALGEAGVEHATVATSSEALALLESADGELFDLLLLDQELPGMTGRELLRLLRRKGHEIPIVLVTIHDEVAEKVRGLEAGADDYIVKPFDFNELVARLRAVVRRSRGAQPIRVGTLQMDPLLRTVKRDGQALDLTPREFDILYVLVQAQERTVSRKEMLRRVWGMSFEPGTNFVQVHLSRLRSKLGAGDGLCIHTVRGQGYRLAATPAVEPAAGTPPALG